MLMVAKRSGQTEEFNPEKIVITLQSVSDEAGMPITKADCNSIIQELQGMLAEKTKVASRELYIMVIGLLGKRRMFELLRRYVERSTY